MLIPPYLWLALGRRPLYHWLKRDSNFAEGGRFCLVVELQREGSATNGATPSSLC